MVKLFIFLLMILISVVFLAALLVNVIRWIVSLIRDKDSSHIKKVIKKNGVILICFLLLMSIYYCVTYFTAYTPSIKDKNGQVVKGSIAELKKISINGHDEWISIRGENKNSPVLLFLAGGPGGTQMAATRHELSNLEKHFVVVNWDQPGSGKSYNCMKRSDITPKTYIKDGTKLTKYLLEKFSKNKIYLMGESWGSALGIFLISEHPEYYNGFIGTGQMVNFKESEKIDYYKAIEITKEKGNKKLVKKLLNQGEPPYYDGNIAWKSGTYLNYLTTYMTNDPNITNGGYRTLRDMSSSEYGTLDSVNFWLGIMFTFNNVYPKLYDTDLRVDYRKLKVPVYFFIGRNDINAPTNLVEDYYNILDAPKKELVWFEHSGHDPWINESDLFVKETLRVFK